MATRGGILSLNWRWRLSSAHSRLIRNPDDELTASMGVRVIAADQPGVGGSSPQKKRRMVDWGEDMEALADALGLTNFAVAGHSGGSPHALAIAFRMPGRVTQIVLVSPVSPLDEKGMARLMINKDLKLIAKLHHLHHLIKWKLWLTTTSQTPTRS